MVKTRLQIDLHCLAVHQNTNKHTIEYTGGEKSLAEKLTFLSSSFFLLSFTQTLDKHNLQRKASLELVYLQSNISFIVVRPFVCYG